MFSFSTLMTSHFGDAATPPIPPLEPRLKPGKDTGTALSPPVSFSTPVGDRRVPRDKDPKKPNFEMIKDARHGILSGFLRQGKLFRASDFVGIVNPRTAIITLNDIYDFETRFLTAVDDGPIPKPPPSSKVTFKQPAGKGAENEKTLRNLFYISLAQDELPSFHLWTKEGELDPVTAAEVYDWGKRLDENPTSPATTAKITRLENERKEKVKQGVEEQQSTQNKTPLGFLDRYNGINLPGLGREPTQGQPAGDIDSNPQISVSTVLAQSQAEMKVLLQFNRGGMYLRESTHKALYNMACWMVENEVEDEEEIEDEDKEDPSQYDMYLDILEPGKEVREEKIASVSQASSRHFQENIKPLLGRPDSKFRVRSTRFQSSWNLTSGFDSGGVGDMKYDLKLERPNFGYCYCSAMWHVARDLSRNSLRFDNALKFLFDWKSSSYPISNHLSIEIPNNGSFDLDRDSDVLVDANIQKIFAKLSAGPVKPDSRPTEIPIRDLVKDDTDGFEFNSPPKHGKFIRESGPGADVHQALSEATAISGGLDVPSIHPRLLTASETNKLQERLRIAEASVDDADNLQQRLRIAEEKLSDMDGLKERLRISEDRARLKSTCPFCAQDWAGATKQQQQDHLKLHQKSIVYQPAPQNCPQPSCTDMLGENQRESTHEAIAEHLRLHIEEEHREDGICEHQNCHTNMYALTAEQQEEHESMHRDYEKIEEERDRLLEQVRDLESTVMERDRQQQQIRDLQDAANERDRLQEELVAMTEERDSLQARAVELEKQLNAAPGLDQGVQTDEAKPETVVHEDPEHPSQPEAPKKLQYCNVCLKSVDKLSANAKTKHADKCKTRVPEFLLLNPAEAKARREERNKGGDIVKPQAKEGAEEGAVVPNTGKKRKLKASVPAASSESQQDETEDTNTVQEPETSKTSGRKTLKRKNDAFKPPKEGESEDEDLESPRKKPKMKAKAAKPDKETAPTRRSKRGQDTYQPPEEEEKDDEAREEIEDEPSSFAKGGKRKMVAAANTISKKARTKK